jgi:Helix-turn-helix domain
VTTPPLTVSLPPDALEAIARRAAEIVLDQLRSERESSTATRSPFMTVAEAADFLRCGERRIYDLRSSGRLTACTDGTGDARNGRALVLRAEVEALVSRSRPVATVPASPHRACDRRSSR